MALEERLLIAVSRLDAFCSDYWWIIMTTMICLLAILAMLIINNQDNKHIK